SSYSTHHLYSRLQTHKYSQTSSTAPSSSYAATKQNTKQQQKQKKHSKNHPPNYSAPSSTTSKKRTATIITITANNTMRPQPPWRAHFHAKKQPKTPNICYNKIVGNIDHTLNKTPLPADNKNATE